MTEYGEVRSISLHSVRVRENTDQKNSEYGQFSRSRMVNFVINYVECHTDISVNMEGSITTINISRLHVI